MAFEDYTVEDYKKEYGADWKAVYNREKANAAAKRIKRPFQKAIAQYAPGGSYGAGIEAGLVRGKKQSMASGMNALIGSGLAGTTMAAGLGKKYEEEVAAPIRANLEGTRAQSISALNVSLAQAQQGAHQFEQGMAQNTAQFNASQAMQKYMADLQAKGQAGQLGLGYAQLAAQGQPSMMTPAMATQKSVALPKRRTLTLGGSTTSTTPAITPGQKMNLGWSSAELTALNKKLGNVATGF